MRPEFFYPIDRSQRRMYREDPDPQIHETAPHRGADLATRVFESEDKQKHYAAYLANNLQKLARLRKEVLRKKIASIHQLSTRIDENLTCPM